MKKRYLSLFFLLGLIFLFLDISEIKGNEEDQGNFQINSTNININRENFYPNETIEINGSWNIIEDYVGTCYSQFRIYNNTNLPDYCLVWKSESFDERGEVFKNVSIPIQSLWENITFNGSIELYVTLYYHQYDPLNSNLEYFYNTTSFKIIKEGNLEFESFNINKDVFYSNDTIQIDALWTLEYYAPELIFTQFKIFNDPNFEGLIPLWESAQYLDIGTISKIINISISEIVNLENCDSINLYVSLFYSYQDRFGIQYSQYISNKTIEVNSSPEFNPNQKGNKYLSVLIPSGAIISILTIGIVLYLSKKNKSKKVEDIVIEF
ncbi:MAG: hypothetical protein R6W84_09330 [Promethearchaeia archaeon]